MKQEIWLAERGWPSGLDGLVRAGLIDPELRSIMKCLVSVEARASGIPCQSVMMERAGIEPATSGLQSRRSPS